MRRVKWDLEESIVLFDLYFRYGQTLSIPIDEIRKISNLLNKRAEILGIEKTETFRNVAGIRMQLACIHYVVTDGKEGFSGASNLFYDTYELYKHNFQLFQKVLKEFHLKVSDFNRG